MSEFSKQGLFCPAKNHLQHFTHLLALINRGEEIYIGLIATLVILLCLGGVVAAVWLLRSLV